MCSVGQFTKVLALLLVSCSVVASDGDRSERDGFLAVTVTLGEVRTPLTTASVFVRGYRHVDLGNLSATLSQTKEGVFGASLPPGIYDVFVSDAGSHPMCSRVAIVAGQREVFYANLKLDLEHMEK